MSLYLLNLSITLLVVILSDGQNHIVIFSLDLGYYWIVKIGFFNCYIISEIKSLKQHEPKISWAICPLTSLWVVIHTSVVSAMLMFKAPRSWKEIVQTATLNEKVSRKTKDCVSHSDRIISYLVTKLGVFSDFKNVKITSQT